MGFFVVKRENDVNFFFDLSLNSPNAQCRRGVPATRYSDQHCSELQS